MTTIKTVSDLKRHADKYEWLLLSNSWFPTVPEHQACWRKAGLATTTQVALRTVRNGAESYSWIDFPKARELVITPHYRHDGYEVQGWYKLTITRASTQPYLDKPAHVMVYLLRPIY